MALGAGPAGATTTAAAAAAAAAEGADSGSGGSGGEGAHGGCGSGQRLTLVHFLAQLEPCLTQEYTLHTLNTP
jgi:hypothetical protein